MAEEEPAGIPRAKKLAVVAIAILLVAASSAYILFTSGVVGPEPPGSVDRTIRFPDDEGRHDDPLELWGVYLLVQGSGGDRFGISAQYGIGVDQTRATRLMTITDEDGFSGVVYRWDQVLDSPFTASKGRLNLSFDQGGLVDRWEQTSTSPSTYTLHLEFSVGPTESAVVDATLTALKAPVLLGEAGKVFLQEHGTLFSYVQTRLAVSGTLVIGGDSTGITGDAWIEHQWGDWRVEEVEYLRLQVSGQQELLSLRLHYGGTGPAWETLLHVRSDGSVTDLTAGDPDLEWLRFWRDPNDVTGRAFPVEWRLVTTGGSVSLRGEAPVLSQRPAAWEGTVDLDGFLSGVPATGRGYALMGLVFRSDIAVTSVQHIPDPEIPTDPSTVVASVTSDVPIANVALSYKLTRPVGPVEFGNVSMSNLTGLWQGSLPSAPLNSVFEFSVVAYDLAGTRAESAVETWTVTV